MRITREILLKLAQEAVAQRVHADRGIISAFATGSILAPEPLLGGTTDIDLVLIHDLDPFVKREIVRLSPEVHLDIAHHALSSYRQPRHLRQDFWLGSAINSSPILLHDKQHWFEFTQASIRSQFWHPENVIARARPLAGAARQAWLQLQMEEITRPEQVQRYLDALGQAANALASLSGGPLTERRFLLDFPDRAQAVNNPGLAAGLAGLIGANEITADPVRGWLPAWQQAYRAAGELPNAPTHLHPHRQAYYERAIDALLDEDQVHAALWPLINTWTQALLSLDGAGDHQAAWREAFALLRLDPPSLPERITGLDAYLDTIEETLDRWSAANGI